MSHFVTFSPLDIKLWTRKMESLDLLRNCLVCKWELKGRNPRLLPCLHSFCKDCLPDLIQGYRYTPTEKEILYEGILSCPVCKQTCFAKDVAENYFLKDFPTATPAMARSCSVCKEKRPAHSLCTTCNKWLCSSCTEEHRHGKETGDHFLSVSLKSCSGLHFHKETVHSAAQRPSSHLSSTMAFDISSARDEVFLKRGTEGGASEFTLCCPMHSQEPLKLFCETCDVLTCRSCLLIEHKEHRFKHLDEALQNQRVILENVTAKVEEKRTGIQVTAKQIEDRLFEVKHLHKKVENQIKMAKMVVMNEINKRTNSLLEQLERITSERKQKLEQQLQGIFVLNRQFEHVQNFINWAVCSKNNIPFLFSKELIVFQIQHLLETDCSTDVGPPLKIRFTWDPSFWTKQLSNLGGLTLEGGHISHSDVPAYGSAQGLHTPLYHGHHSPAPQPEPISNHSHQFPVPIQCPTPVCCSHCLSVPHMNKGPLPHQSMNHHQNFRQLPEMQSQQHFPQQYNIQQHEKEQRCTPQSLKIMQSGLEQQSRPEPENISVRMGKHLQVQQLQQTTPSVYTIPPQDVQQIHTSHAQQLHSQPSLQTPAVQVQLGHPQKLKLNHLQQSQQQQQQPPPPQPSPSSSQKESTHEQVIQQSLDIMHHQFELEEMKKDLELLLQAQGQPSLQLNQTKQPQHVQQTIVGQINYIVRQPAPVQQQIQDEVQQLCEDSAELDGQKPVLPLDRNVMPAVSQPLSEEFSAGSNSPESTLQHPSLNPVRKRSASLSIVGFSNTLEMELSSTRLTKSADPQMQGISAVTFGQSQSMPHASDIRPESVPSYNLASDRAINDLSPGITNNLATGGVLLGNAKCKLENEDFSTTSDPLGNDSATTSPSTINELALPMQKMLEEPINLSVKKSQQCASPSTPINNAPCLLSASVKQLSNEKDFSNCEKEHFEMDVKNNQNISTYAKELKIPYVRLERLKICVSESGELPVFKLQPQKSEQDGTFLLIVECGTQSSSMAIKVNQDNPSEGKIPKLGGSENRKIPINPPSGQVPSPFVDIFPVDHKLNNGIPSTRKPPLPQEISPIENEDFCAVCLNGGELLCCDHCPKVFHLSCHVPALLSFPVGEWVCTLCCNPLKPEVEYDCENTRYRHINKALHGLDDCDQKKCEKLVLFLFCSSLSLPFHEPVSPLARHYYQIIKRPMDLSIIRRKLQKREKSHYSAPEQLVADVRLMFWNCAKFNYPDSEVAEAGRCLEVFFEGKLKEIYPDKHFPLMQQEDSDTEEVESEHNQMPPKGFQWPSYGQDCIQPKRRRRHAEIEKTKRTMFQPSNSLPQV
ncbi:PREDICTED: tripartite motif-containing protein 66 isoform X1 [Gavialis gangeticus]|uniref:tripartite motif-containing protein 66 isoform X1 n=1 Tax=Gavialis gangeticus TaxID=94835 RepID=UPI00092F6899|nr:PREDICTED: tripartite motif-containing protein 66 isoform X1 [Gavialis gangeticus]